MKRRLLLILAVAVAIVSGVWILFLQIQSRRSQSLRVADYDFWRAGYARAIAATPEVRSYRIWRGQDDPNYVITAENFDSREVAERVGLARRLSSQYGTERRILAMLISPLDATRASSKVQSHDHWANAKVCSDYDAFIFTNNIGNPHRGKFTKRKRISTNSSLPHNNRPPLDTNRCDHEAAIHIFSERLQNLSS